MSESWVEQLPEDVRGAVQPLIEALPLDQAMSKLVVDTPGGDAITEAAQKVLDQPVIAARPELASAIWLYVDQLDRSHRISQQIDTPTGSYWHGIMHRREGDFSNSHYWFRRTGPHPAIAVVQQAQPDYEPHEMIDRVAQAHHDDGADRDFLLRMQRDEWAQLFAWCARG